MKVPVSGKVITDHDKKYAHQAVDDGWLTEGRWSLRFQSLLNLFLGVRSSILTNSGSSSNLLALSALTSIELGDRRILRGDEVITTAVNFPTTVNPIIQVGAVPVFVDVELPSMVGGVEAVLSMVTEKTKAVILSHTLGYPFSVSKLAKALRERKIYLIEDCCDALGSRVSDGIVGSFGDFATFSFYPAHQITSGEGGALVTSNPLLAKLATSFRDWGRACWCQTGMDNTCGKRFNGEYDHKYQYDHIGYNLKMTDIQAAILCAQIERVHEFTETRRRNHQYLVDQFVDNGLQRYFDFIRFDHHTDPAWFGFPLICREGVDRNKLCRWLDNQGVGNRPVFSGNILRQPAYKDIVYRSSEDLTNSNIVHERAFWVGCWHGLTTEHLDYTIEKMKEYFA